MKNLDRLLVTVVLAAAAFAQAPDQQNEARQAVRSFYTAFNAHAFENAQNYTTEDWNHINPSGGWTRGREAVLAELKQVHSTFLKGVTATIDDMNVRFATADVAVVTVTAHASAITTPDGIKHENPRGISTFVLVKRKGRWLIMQDQNTSIADSH